MCTRDKLQAALLMRCNSLRANSYDEMMGKGRNYRCDVSTCLYFTG